ncbi:MAG: amino acid adenylation domain-containing protein [Gammaproteobacteria bacterium (ex Lamellibrachia satsuma)]|nr:MAG: amino acid adenylation domain-containing protein [Gammaproteobacteria bacterium (ex Lamellibrachia satsuma)]
MSAKVAGRSSCYVIGGESFLIRCVEHLLQQGFDVYGIFSSDPDVRAWGEEQEIPCFNNDSSMVERLRHKPFDFLFSIVNLSVLPEAAVESAQRMAINFHDGPLPRYAGLNTPAWALLNRESQHGVTWHQIAGGVDEGDILTQRIFPISVTETSLSLNAKCYESGLDSFQELVQAVLEENLQPIPQDLSHRSYFGYCKRPEAAAVLDFELEAEALEAIFRALDFGAYDNPLALPKLWLGEWALAAENIELLQSTSEQPGGTLLEIGEQGLSISTASWDVRISGLRDYADQNRNPLEVVQAAGLSVGNRLPFLSHSLREDVTQVDEAVCRDERFWRRKLQQLELAAIPYARHKPAERGGSTHESSSQTLSGAPGGDRLAALFAHYIARLTGHERFDLGYSDQRLQVQARKAAGLISPLVPWRIDLREVESVRMLCEQLESSLVVLREHNGFSRDLALRVKGLEGRLNAAGLPPLPVTVIRGGEAEALLTDGLPLALVVPGQDGALEWHYDTTVYSSEIITRMQAQFEELVRQIGGNEERAVGTYSILSQEERKQLLQDWNDTSKTYAADDCIHQLFAQQAAQARESTALVFQDQLLSYQELDLRANRLAQYLIRQGVGPDVPVGISLERSPEMVVALLGVLKAGGAYVPMDPHYPKERLRYMVQDAGLSLILCGKEHLGVFGGLEVELLDPVAEWPNIARFPGDAPQTGVRSSNLAYIIYTSGSTGKPKGVMVEHRNVVNFFTGMDDRIGADVGTWLAVTSISFDISVLELFWTLCRGFKVVLYGGDEDHLPTEALSSRYPDKSIDFSLFFWNYSSNEDIQTHSKYHLLMEAVKFGDGNGFTAAWTPERHFHSFGGLFPNPAVISAALAAVTNNIQLRSGSVVLPLHSPIRVAEDWSVVDNLSDGRVGIAIAAGWQPNDFAIKPENHANAKQVMMDSLEQVRQLWRGETVVFPGPKGDVEVTTQPRPVQDELPVWLTAAGNPETFRMAGEAGCGILTHLLGQSVEDVSKSIQLYRDAWKSAGHPGEGHVVIMLHTLIGEDEEAVKQAARGPMKSYLTSAATLVKAAAWHFPTFKDLSTRGVQTIDEFVDNISAEDFDDLLDFAFERYYRTSGLFGTPERALEMVDQLKEIGVDEIGCLVDYGVESEVVLDHLPFLNKVKEAAGRSNDETVDYSIAGLIRRNQVSHFQCTPSMATMLLNDIDARAALAGLDRMMVGGEAFPPSVAAELHQLVSGKVINMYGPTETTIWSTTHQLDGELEQVPIGRPISNTRIYLLDEQLQPTPASVPGELYIGGDGVVRGYLGQPELTAERFLPDPFSGQEGARIYRTGDLACYRKDGILDFLGRVDHQVKIRGHRIELGEIDAHLGLHPEVVECAVVDREDASGSRMLVAYLQSAHANPPEPEVLKRFLAEKLPSFMLPSLFVFLVVLPKTPNGKIDRKALPDPDSAQVASGAEYVAPRDALEEAVADIWQEVLLLDRIGINDNFFEHGGHSLTAAQLIARLRAIFGVQLPLRTMFEAPTIEQVAERLVADETHPGQVQEIAGWVQRIYSMSNEELATALQQQLRQSGDQEAVVVAAADADERAAQCEALLGLVQGSEGHQLLDFSDIPRTDAEQPRLSFSQQRMWFIDQLEPGAHYNDYFALELTGELDAEALERSLNDLVRRHDVLRTVFASEEGRPYQVIAEELQLPLEQHDLSDQVGTDQESSLQKQTAQQICMPLDLALGPVLRTLLFKLDAQHHLFLLIIHQGANDSWSLGVFMSELNALYNGYRQGREDVLSPPSLQYADFAEWQRERLSDETLVDSLTYWQERLAGELPVLDLPQDRPRLANQTFRGARIPVTLSQELTESLAVLGQTQGCTLYMTLLAGFKVLLSRYSRMDDIIVGSPIANRDHPQLESLLGMFVNNIVLRTDLSGTPDFNVLLSRVKETATGAYAHAELPFEKLVQALHLPVDMSHTPLFQVMFDFHNTPMPEIDMEGLAVNRRTLDAGMSRFDLTLELAEGADGVAGYFEYNPDLFDEVTIQAMSTHLHCLLEAVVTDPTVAIPALPMLSPEEKTRLVDDWNETDVELAGSAGFHHLFEQQVAQAPDEVAVIFGESQLTYRELNVRSNQLAHYLRTLKVGPDVLVGLCLERSVDMLVALLGVLKAGGAYLPLDPDYPADRIGYILDDADVALLLTHRSLLEKLPACKANVLAIDAEKDLIRKLGADTPEPLETADNLAYVIYTSGSTGRPKGVQVQHQAVSNFLTSMAKCPGIDVNDVVLALTTLSFDIAVLELYLPLIVGAKVVIASREQALDGRDLKDLMQDHGVSLMQATPATWRLLVDSGWQGDAGLKVLCGGEALSQGLARDLVRLTGGVWNMYGPTETTVWSTCFHITSEEEPIRIGRPIDNTRLYVLDQYQQLVPVGVHGELYIGGLGVTRGYLGRPELTEERFVEDPFSGDGTMMYRTGDLVRYRVDGELEYLNRLDNQVKVRGFRIELGEIESVLAEYGKVKRSVVDVREVRLGDRRLAAYYELEAGTHTTPTELRKHLRAELPDYMIPQHFVELDELPLTPNGKVDRKALPAPFASAAIEETFEAPKTALEQGLAAIWQEVIGIDQVGLHDNFFDLGGHSLLAMQVVAKAQEQLGTKLSLRSLVSDSLSQISAGLEPVLTGGPEEVQKSEEPSEESVSFAGRDNRAERGVLGRIKSKLFKD